ncbi:MAG: YCF48-related protein [Gammaproteobacteria bacterium]|nr:YCF48-related protein [Gammaproteobacteria bacterium]
MVIQPAAAAEEPPVGLVQAAPIVGQPSKSFLMDIANTGSRLVAVGEHGVVIVSEDGGETWDQVPFPADATLTAVDFVSPEKGWIVGHDAVIAATEDGGNSWVLQQYRPDLERPLLDVWFAGPTEGYAVGANGLILRTHDGGANWELDTVIADDGYFDPHLFSLTQVASGKLMVAAEQGMMFFSDDEGATWSQLEDSPYHGSFFGIISLGGNELLAYAMLGHVYRSTDGGGSWAAIESGIEHSLLQGKKLSDGRVVLVGLAGSILVSDDGGQSFVVQSLPVRIGLTSFADLGNGEIVVTTARGVMRAPIN